MDVSKTFTILCACLFILCLTLTITALVVLHNALQVNQSRSDPATVPVGNSDPFSDTIDQSFGTTVIEPVDADPSPSERYCMKAVNGTVGIYTSDGYLMRMLSIRVETLPTAEQKALSEGITASSWEEVLSLIQDYE